LIPISRWSILITRASSQLDFGKRRRKYKKTWSQSQQAHIALKHDSSRSQLFSHHQFLGA
jgi:hypothetical protein